MFAVQANGRQLTTIEGLASDGQLHAAPGSVLERARAAVRLLHAGLHHDRHRAATSQSAARPKRRSARAWKATCAAARATRTSCKAVQIGQRPRQPAPRSQSACAAAAGGHERMAISTDDWRQDPPPRGPAPDHRRRPLRRRPGSRRHADDGHRAQPAPARADHVASTPTRPERMPGVVAVLTAADFKPLLTGHAPGRARVRRRQAHRPGPLPDRRRTKRSSRASQSRSSSPRTASSAVDAAPAVEVEYEPLPAVTDMLEGARARQPEGAHRPAPTTWPGT